MPKKSPVSTRVRLIGLWASAIALVALSVAVLSGNQDAGFGRSVTHEEQVSLLLIAALLCAVQGIAYVIHRHRKRPLRPAAPSARNQSSRNL